MRFTGAAVDSDHSDPWIDAIGRFVINFGYIEYLTFEWLDLFASSDRFSDVPLAKRISDVRKRIEGANLPRGLKRDVRSEWAAAEKLVDFRNRIAHGPVILVYKDGDERKPPTIIASYSKRRAIKSGSPVQAFSSLTEVRQKSAEVANIAQKLQKLLEEIRCYNNA